jgi:sugar phosphate isomerase/epimerase
MNAMHRRELLKMAAVALGAGAAGNTGFAQAGAAAVGAKKVHIDAYSRTLHWLRKPEEIAEACHQIGNATLDLTVRAYPGHVQPDKVVTDLPPFVKTLAQNGITVTVLGADIVDDKTPYIEEMLGTASSLGIRYNWWRGFNFDYTKPYPPQIEALKPRLEGLVKIQEKYGMKAMYHPQGGPFFDQLELIRNFDPRYVSLHFDTGHWMQIAQPNMAAMIMMAGPYVGGFVWKDGVVEKRDPASTPTAQAGPPDGGARGGRGGRGGGYNGWGTRQVPVGTGMVDFALAARTLKVIGFNGPTECQPEWTGLGGAESGRDTLTLPRETVIGLLKHDYDTIHAALAAAGIA